MTEVSVVLGTYNDTAVLKETLDSVLKQDFPYFELIVVDDGSTGTNVTETLRKYSFEDSRVKTICKSNEGLTRALIDGCAMARGEFIARIDAGDVMLPGRLAKQASLLRSYPDCAFVSCWTEFCGPEWEQLWLARGEPGTKQPRSLLSSDPQQGLQGEVPHHGSVMFRRAVYEDAGGYRPEFFFGQDWDLWYRLAERGTFAVWPETLYRARIFPGSISMTHKHLQDEAAVCSLNAFVARCLGENEAPWLIRAAAARPSGRSETSPRLRSATEQGHYFVGEALRRRGNRRCRRYFLRGMRLAPFRLRNYVRLLQSLVLADTIQSSSTVK